MLLKNGKVFIDGELVEKDIFIQEGKIKKIGQQVVDKEVIDCSGKIILPGIIDPHVHLRDPGLTHKEDFFTGSMAAAAGGVTTFLDMPNNIPAVLTNDILNHKRRLASERSIVNYGFHFGSSENNLDEIMNVKNVASTKIFMNVSTGNLKIEHETKLEQIFRHSKIISVHAEGEQIKKAIFFAKKTNRRLYLCHISSKAEIEYLKKNKSGNIFIEVTPHHLFLTEDKNDAYLAVKPSLKSDYDQKSLWAAIYSGMVDTVGSDHAPHTKDEKSMQNPPFGMPGLETTLPLLLDAINHERLALKRLVQLCCENPANIFEIRNKGYIRVGYDADLTIVDMDIKKKVDNKKLFTKCEWSPFNKKVLKGWPVMTIVNGNIVFDNGKIIERIKGKEVRFG